MCMCRAEMVEIGRPEAPEASRLLLLLLLTALVALVALAGLPPRERCFVPPAYLPQLLGRDVLVV